MRHKSYLVAAMTAAISLLLISPARADGNEVSLMLFHSPNADARWAQFTPSPAGDPDTWSVKLQLGTNAGTCLVNDFSCFAGATLKGVPGEAPATPPSFDFYSTVASASGGSPRLHIDFSDSGSIELRPLSWVANTWTHEDGGSTDWDNNGGTCGFRYEQLYATVLACHSGATVTDAIVVTDSNWLAGPYIHYIDNISYGNALITSPENEGCHEGDGNGHFRGDHGDGNFDADSDGCMDGDQDHVDSDNRGDGKDFHSTGIDSVTLNSLGNSETITGTGTSAGVPVTFVLVEAAPTALTPGSVSLTFSDGFANTGDLLDGTVSLN